jgi:hypothetical protein
VIGIVHDRTMHMQLPLELRVNLPDSHQVKLTRTRERQQSEIPPARHLTSSADESLTFDLPPFLAASDAVISPILFFFTSSQKTGFPGSFAHSVFSLHRMLFPNDS